MRRYYFGPSFGISTESLMYTEVNIDELLSPQTSNSSSRIGLLSIDVRVCTNPPGLGLRIQRLAVLKRQEVQNIFIEKDIVWVCTHLANYPAESPDFIKSSLKNCYSDFSETIISLIQTYCEQDGTPDSDTHFDRQGKCGKCNTSWKLELRGIETQDVCLLLMRWKDLGPGLDPEDNRWRSKQEWAQPKTLKPSEMVGDPRLRFERPSDCSSSQPMSQEDMFQRNLSLLRGKRYQTVMRKSWGPWYYLHGKEREVNHSRCIIS
ncbi:hypothetical protein N7493_000023 [Penicillium malachiteum]|uniref:Uncharacterized protein n=1 Tax=Penicillium malachiteum TaxID=1324776 RepID=A0AAD6HW51_9EURO|nr:hypothetical protein N7493_000023 [Penicillium malachiteum]